MKPAFKAALLILGVGIAAALLRTVRKQPVPPPLARPSPVTPSFAATLPATSDGNLLEASRWVFYYMNGAEGSRENLAASESGLSASENATRIRIVEAGKQIFDVHYIYHLDTEAFAANEPVTFRFKARSSSKNLVSIQMQRFEPPAYPACWTKFVTLTPEWKEYVYTFNTDAYAPREAALVFKLGQSTGVIDLADLSLKRGAAK